MSLDLKQLELRRETLFKDAVLTSADSKSVQIIAEAQQKSGQALAEAKQSCRLADHDLIAAELRRDTERQYSTLAQDARQALLKHRTALVDEMFAEVAQRLAAFTGEKGYPGWLAAQAKKYAAQAGEAPVAYLRQADMPHAGAVEKALPGCTVQPAHDIVLGGLRLQAGRRLFDETLDTRLNEEKTRFTLDSGLHI